MSIDSSSKMPDEISSWLDSPSAPFNNFLRTPSSDNVLKQCIHPIRIGSVSLPNNLVLAPMAGVTDGTFRLLCSRLGAGYSVSELASSRAIVMHSRQTIDLVKFQGQIHPYGVQIFGSDPDTMAEAASIIDSLNICEIIDINMGCPVSKVVKTGAGSGLMKTPDIAAEIIKKVSSAVKVPVTAKFRLGWTENSINVKEFTHAVIEAGAKAIAVHARTRQAMYTGKAQWQYLQGIKDICGNIPFFANGDIESSEDILRLFEETGCDGYLIGRGAIGNPWIFSELLGHKYFNTQSAKLRIIKHQMLDMMMEHGDSGIPLFRVHLFGYLKNQPGAAKIRHTLSTERSPHQVFNALEPFFAETN